MEAERVRETRVSTHIPDGVRVSFLQQAKACRKLGSPFTARLLTLFAERPITEPTLARAIYGWPGDPGPHGDNVPLRIAGALHTLVLTDRDMALVAVYPPEEAKADDDTLWAAVDQALSVHSELVLDRLTVAPQTNEVRRAGGLLPGLMAVAERTRRPLAISEIGASAGLALSLDRYCYHLGGLQYGDPESPVQIRPSWSGSPAPQGKLTIVDRAGCDLAPLNPGDPTDCTKMLSYVWPDQQDRLDRTRAALAIAAQTDFQVARQGAAEWLQKRLSSAPLGAAHVVYHSIVWQYLSRDDQDRCRVLMEAAGALATTETPLAWLRMEVDGRAPGAGLALTLWPGGTEHQIGRADFHGRWVDWWGLT